MANGLKYGEQDIDALMFDAPISDITSRYDFTGWSVNQDQPSDGVAVTKNKITITKFKPNVPIIVSNFSGTGTGSTPTIAELCSSSKNLTIKTSGLSANNTAGLFSAYGKTNQIITFWTAYLVGAYFAPYNTSLNAEINVAVDVRGNIVYSDDTTGVLADDNILRGDGGGYGRIGMVGDRVSYTKDIPDWKSFPNSGTDHHWQLALGIYTSVSPNSGEYITLSEPVIIQIENTYIVDPTTIEGYTAAVGEDGVYSKEMTYDNVLTRHDLSFKEVNTFTEPIAGFNAEITSNYGSEQKTAFVISERNYRSLYEHMRLPAITNLGTLLRQSFPFKFWATLKRDPAHTHIWDSIIEAFTDNAITNPTFANHLFSKSSGDIQTLTLKFDVGTTDGQDNTIDMMGIFDHSNLVSNINFNFITGTVYSLVNAFRNTKTLQSLTFNKIINVSDWQGAFEGSNLVNFPANLYAVNRWHNNTTLSEPDCSISDTADGSSLEWFGNWKNGQSQQSGIIYSATLTPATVGANAVVGSAVIDNSVASTDEMTITARFCPSVSVPDFDSQLYNIRRLNTADAGDGVVFLIQGIGYDSSNNKIAATPTHIVGGGSTLPIFNVSTLFSAISYTPDSLNTDYVAVKNSSSMFADDFTSRYYHLTSFNDSWTRRYLELSLSATGLQRMDIKMAVVNVVVSTSEPSYVITSTSTPHLYSYDVSHDITAWGIDGLASARITQHVINVSPYCANAFYNSSISQIREVLDMKFVSPVSGMINVGNRSVFGNENLTSAYIINLNKGDWSLDGTARNSACGGNLANLDEDSANFLLENVFDLTRNTSEAYRIENDINSFNTWTASGNGRKRPIAFYASGNASIYKEGISTGGDMVLQVTLVNCTAVVKRSTVVIATLTNGKNVVSSIPSGSSVTIQVTATGDYPSASIELENHFLYELTENLTSANLYLPAEWGTRSIIHSASVQEANRRGWTVYVGGQVYTI